MYFHKTTRSAEKVFSHLFERVFRLVQCGQADLVGLSRTNPIVAFGESPDSLQNALRLDDAVIWGSVPELTDSKEGIISKLATMLRKRHLPKAIDLRKDVSRELGDGVPIETIDKAVLLAKNAIDEWCIEQDAEVPPIWVDTTQRAPYKEFQEDTGPLNQILIRDNGRLVDLKEVSPIVKSISPFKLDRVYVPFLSECAEKRVREVIKNKAMEAKGE